LRFDDRYYDINGEVSLQSLFDPSMLVSSYQGEEGVDGLDWKGERVTYSG